ncbi:MAG: NUDIX hydrolase [Gemmatimonadaceae bacterium]
MDTVRFPNGTTGELEMVRHSGASAVVPFITPLESPDPVILLIRQYRYAAGGFVHEVPAGRLDPGEMPEECARRELQEETGYLATDLVRLSTFYTTPGFTDERIHLFAAFGLTAGEVNLEVDEIIEAEQVRLSRAVEMVASGEIVDGKTMISVLLADQLRKKQ